MVKKINKLRSLFKKYRIDGYIVPSNDEFQNEYVPQHLNRLKWLTGFSGSNGVLIVTMKNLLFYTDGRYLTQAANELSKEYLICDRYLPSSCNEIAKIVKEGMNLGYDPMLHNIQNIEYYKKLSINCKFNLVSIEQNLVDLIWKDKEIPSIKPIQLLAVEYTGVEASDKIQQVAAQIKGYADYLLVTSLDNICWLLNIRGHDVPCSPLILSYLLLDKMGKVFLFTEPDKIPQGLLNNIEILHINQIKSFYKNLIKSGNIISICHKTTASWFLENSLDIANSKKINQKDNIFNNLKLVKENNTNINKTFVNLQDNNEITYCKKNIVIKEDPILLLKSCKNSVELNGIVHAHLLDGIAVTKFLYWLEQNIQYGIDEIKAAEQLLSFRKQNSLFQYPSFETISAYADNAAIIHYQPTIKSCKEIQLDNLYLLDSGGQYLCGTTDVTRTICLGNPKEEHKCNFTLVLKGHINLAQARFPEQTTGHQLDSLARYYLWQAGLNYSHGTGHGVGHFLSVHEGPQRISPDKKDNVTLQPGMILSNEPGYYKTAEYGIRIESIMSVQRSSINNFLEFQTLTLVPIAYNLINFNMLTSTEMKWLVNYHKLVADALNQYLEPAEKKYLFKHLEIYKNYC